MAIPAAGQSLAKLDPRALAMGGAFVAVADGWAAIQWNPAALFVGARREIAFSGGEVPLEGGPWVDALRALRGDVAAGTSRLEAEALLASAGAGLAGERHIGIYVSSMRWGAAFQQIDYGDELAELAGSDAVIDTANLRAREFIGAVAQPFAQGSVIVGGAFKLVDVEAKLRNFGLSSAPLSGLSARDLLAEAREGIAGSDRVFSVDAGIIVVPSYRFRIGAVVKNLNAPELDLGFTTITRLPRQIRVGGMLRAHPQLKLSADIDLYSQPFVDGGRQRRELAGGVEWTASRVALRGGLLFDLEAVERKPLYAFGLGVLGGRWRIDGAGTYHPERDGLGWAVGLVGEW